MPRLALRVVRARLDRDREGLCVPLICVVLFGAACFFYAFTELVVPAFFPVLHLAFRPAVACAAAAASLPKDSPSSVAQTAQCVRIILYVVESRGGSPATPQGQKTCLASALLTAS